MTASFFRTLRSITHAPGASALMVASIALAVGAATVVFSVFEGVLLRSLPYRNPDELVNVWIVNHEFLEADDPESRLMGERFPTSFPIYQAWRDHPASPFRQLAAYSTFRPTLDDPENGERVAAVRAGTDLFATLGVEPVLGRSFSPAEVGDDQRVAVITNEFWRGRFGGDPDILGRTISLQGAQHAVIGVMPPGFYFPTHETSVLVPFSTNDVRSDANTLSLQVTGRLHPGVDAGMAGDFLSDIGDEVGERTGVYFGSVDAHVMSRRDLVVGDVDTPLSILMAAVLVSVPPLRWPQRLC